MSPVASRRYVRPGGEERGRARRDPPRPGERGPAVALDEVVERPFGAPVGGARCALHPGRRSLVEAHRHPGVANLVVLGRGRVVLGVVEVEPRAVRILVPDEPIDARLRRAAELGRGDRRAALRRGHRPERRDEDQGQGQPGPPAPGSRSSPRGRGGRGEGAGSGSANQAVSGSRLNDERRGRGAAQARAVPVHDLERGARWGGLDAKAGEPVERAHDRAQSPVARLVGSMRITRSRIDGVAQTSSTAMPRSEKTCTDADASIVTWKTTATHTAA